MLVDFFIEFRFEYLWPFWMLVRSFYDSFKHQGLVRGVGEGEKREGVIGEIFLGNGEGGAWKRRRKNINKEN